VSAIAEIIGAFSLVLLLCQGTAALILLSRLIKGAIRRPPLQPKNSTSQIKGKVSAVVPTLNEVERIDSCLHGLSIQGDEVREIIIVDSNSQDGTQEKVKQAALDDSRFHLITDDPLPNNWVGRPWALHTGFLNTSVESEWFLGIDADTQPQKGLVASLLDAAEKENYDLISLAPQFILKYPGEWWLQPALLVTLLYRFDSAGVNAQNPDRVMANGQCFLCRRSVLEKVGGYSSASSSFCDDVTLARQIAAAGFKVGFLDGSKIFKVRMYEGAIETWREWGRSLDLKDASSAGQVWSDFWLLLNVQGLPLILSLLLFGCWLLGYSSLSLAIALSLNLFLLIIRFALLWAIARSYDRPKQFSFASGLFWLSPFADPLAVLRILISSMQKPKQWRGRIYQ
jgi:dolichol-phosphate mannosyltransferase